MSMSSSHDASVSDTAANRQSANALENGYPVIVVPKEQRAVYMNLLASCDVDGMKKFFSKLMENERQRMAEYNIDVSGLTLKSAEETGPDPMNSNKRRER